MRCLLAALSLFVLTQSAPLQSDQEAKILQYEFNTDGKGNYNYSFSTSNGITKSETGTVVDEGLPSQYILVEGKVFYITPDGNEEAWMYEADKDGFRLLPPQLLQGGAPPSAVVASLLG
ncbi:unnamed protein product, partial [Brenthis ino]